MAGFFSLAIWPDDLGCVGTGLGSLWSDPDGVQDQAKRPGYPCRFAAIVALIGDLVRGIFDLDGRLVL
jgi:hypothetical protein